MEQAIAFEAQTVKRRPRQRLDGGDEEEQEQEQESRRNLAAAETEQTIRRHNAQQAKN